MPNLQFETCHRKNQTGSFMMVPLQACSPSDFPIAPDVFLDVLDAVPVLGIPNNNRTNDRMSN